MANDDRDDYTHLECKDEKKTLVRGLIILAGLLAIVVGSYLLR